MPTLNLRCDHEALKADPSYLRAVCSFVGIGDSEWTILELYNCPICRSTISLPGIGPEKADDYAR